MTAKLPSFPKGRGKREYHLWRVETIKTLKNIRNSPRNLSVEEGHDVVPDLIKEFLEALEGK